MEFYAWFVTFTVSLPVHGDSVPRDDSSQQGASAVSRLHPPSAANYRRSLVGVVYVSTKGLQLCVQ